jgi:hypothetical protein
VRGFMCDALHWFGGCVCFYMHTYTHARMMPNTTTTHQPTNRPAPPPLRFPARKSASRTGRCRARWRRRTASGPCWGCGCVFLAVFD